MSLNTEFILKMDDVISGDFGSYQIKELMGKGTFGRVTRCIDCSKNQSVAIKISQLQHSKVTKNEATILQRLSSLGQDNNVVKFITAFQHQDHYFLVMEHLDQSLYDFMRRRQFNPLHLLDICYITKQLLETFKELEKYKLVHGDLKLDNVMLVNHKVEPLKIKLIDFGFSTTVSSLVPGSVLQAIGYRAPEVSLGTKLDEAVDMWSLGCVMAFLFIGQNFFPEKCEYEMMRIITQIQGMPDVQQLEEGLFVDCFFKNIRGNYHLISPKNYMETTGKRYKPCKNVSKDFTCLEHMLAYHPQQILEEEKEETGQFFSFLNELLQVNPAKRITPGKALTHPFIKQMIAKQTTASGISIISCLRSEHSSITARNNDTGKVSTGGPKTNLSNSEDKMETRNKKIQERVPTGWLNRNVETESDDIYGSGCSKSEWSIITLRGTETTEEGELSEITHSVIQNEPGSEVTSADVGCFPYMPKRTQGGNRSSSDSTNKTNKSTQGGNRRSTECCKKTARETDHRSNSKDESTLETTNMKMPLVNRNVERERVSKNEPGRNVKCTDLGCFPYIPKRTQGGNKISSESTKKTNKSKDRSKTADKPKKLSLIGRSGKFFRAIFSSSRV